MTVVVGEWWEEGVIRREGEVTAVQRHGQLLVVGAEVRVRIRLIVHGQVPVT